MKLIVLALIFQFVISCWPKTNIIIIFINLTFYVYKANRKIWQRIIYYRITKEAHGAMAIMYR